LSSSALELYCYWHLPGSAAQQTRLLAAVGCTQKALCQQHPGLQARLLTRQDQQRAATTITEAAANAVAEAAGALGHYAPERHHEVFALAASS
jgi:hypothetical protein